MDARVRTRLLDLATAAAALSAIAMAVLTLARDRPSPQPAHRRLSRHDQSELSRYGVIDGRPDAPVMLTAIWDHGCPFCVAALADIEAVRSRFPDDAVAIRWRYLPFHPGAALAAVAETCAAAQARFRTMRRYLVVRVEPLDSLDWDHASALAGVPDTAAFRRCLKSPVTQRGLSVDSAHVRALGIHGTPTIAVGDKLYFGSPGYSVLRTHIERLLTPRR